MFFIKDQKLFNTGVRNLFKGGDKVKHQKLLPTLSSGPNASRFYYFNMNIYLQCSK